MSMLALFAPPSISSRLDILKVTKMCLFHDKSTCFSIELDC
jgi:putative hydrolase of HD superfamily